MDIKAFIEILTDKHFPDYGKLQHKYKEAFPEFLSDLSAVYYKSMPITDFSGNAAVYISSIPSVQSESNKLLLHPQGKPFGIKAAEEEIIASNAIESIDFKRESVRSILKGLAPKDEQENRILGQKKGFEFICDPANKITEENLFKLYMLTVGDFLCEEDRLLPKSFYRHDEVYIVSDRLEHSGIEHTKLPDYMKSLIEYINRDDGTDDLIKAAVIHFYFSYLHPYFDGNGRIARLLHLWFLLQKGYKSALFVPFSSQIAKSKKAYYNAFTMVEANAKISGRLDVTPFLIYFVDSVYNKMTERTAQAVTFEAYEDAMKSGKITEKEAALWRFVLSAYGTDEFSTKQLEKDFGNAAYATIRSFVLKFEELELLNSVKYGVRVKYHI